jgi:hypothetical protein
LIKLIKFLLPVGIFMLSGTLLNAQSYDTGKAEPFSVQVISSINSQSLTINGESLLHQNVNTFHQVCTLKDKAQIVFTETEIEEERYAYPTKLIERTVSLYLDCIHHFFFRFKPNVFAFSNAFNFPTYKSLSLLFGVFRI